MTAPAVDIAIVGGGLVGSLLALSLVNQRQQLLASGRPAWRIAVLDSAAPAGPANADGPLAGRSTALSESSRQLLVALGLWEQIEPLCAPIETIHVSERGSCGITHLAAADSQLAAFGYVVENQPLLALLHQQLAGADIDWLAPCQVERLTVGRVAQRLTLDSGSLDAGLVVSAEGSGAALAAQLGIVSERWGYQQQAIVANLALVEPHRGIAYERFDRPGPMALLPLPDSAGVHRAALVWTHPEGAQERWLSASDEVFCAEIECCFGERIGAVSGVGARLAFPLALQRASEQVRRGVAVVGNAAHTLHPVAGQGFNLSLRDVAALAEELLAGRLAGAAAGELSVLQRYADRQQDDQSQTIAFSDLLPKLFASRWPVVAGGRRAGLVAMELLPQLRQRFATFGMGSDRG